MSKYTKKPEVATTQNKENGKNRRRYLINDYS
jgi:hypothetical protein